MVTLIVAVEQSQGIGYKNSMPWPHLKGDMQWFRKNTTNNVVIMGSKTFDSIGKPLPQRINVVLSRSKNYSYQGGADHCFSDPDLALTFCQREYVDKEIFIIGGSEIYNHFLPMVNRFLITEIQADFTCDKFFNLSYVRKNFTKVRDHATFNDPIKYTIKEYSL